MRHAIVVCFAPVVRFFFKVIQVSACTVLSIPTGLGRRAGALRAARLEGFAPSSVVRVHAQRGVCYSLKFLINRDLARQHGAETCPALSLANDNNEALRRASRRLGQTAAQSTIARPTAAPFAATETRLQKDCKAASVRVDAAQCCITFRFRKQHPSPPSACSPLLQ